MLTLHIEAPSYQELVAEAERQLGKSVVPVDVNTTAGVTLPEATVERQSRRGRPRKTEQAAATQPSAEAAQVSAVASQAQVDNSASSTPTTPLAEAATPAAEGSAMSQAPAAGVVIPTTDECRAALKPIADHSLEIATSLLGDFGAERISLIPEDKRAAFIEACKQRAAKLGK